VGRPEESHLVRHHVDFGRNIGQKLSSLLSFFQLSRFAQVVKGTAHLLNFLDLSLLENL
jgi:hypothetical protein